MNNPAKVTRRLFRAMEAELGPLAWHDHANGRDTCPACQATRPGAPHFPGCECGHCPAHLTTNN